MTKPTSAEIRSQSKLCSGLISSSGLLGTVEDGQMKGREIGVGLAKYDAQTVVVKVREDVGVWE